MSRELLSLFEKGDIALQKDTNSAINGASDDSDETDSESEDISVTDQNENETKQLLFQPIIKQNGCKSTLQHLFDGTEAKAKPRFTTESVTTPNRFTKVRIDCKKDEMKALALAADIKRSNRFQVETANTGVVSPPLPPPPPQEVKPVPEDNSAPSSKEGSVLDVESLKSNEEKFSSLKRFYSRSSLISAISNFKDKTQNVIVGKGKQQEDRTKLKIAVGIFFLICFSIVVTSHVLYDQQAGVTKLFPDMKLLDQERRILLQIPNSVNVVPADLGVNLPLDLHPYACLPGVHHNQEKGEICSEWKDKARLKIRRLEGSCYSFEWQALTSSISPMDCWDPYNKGNWYGGGERLNDSWPLQKSSVKLSPFVTGDEDQTEWGNVIRRFFINSAALTIKVSDETPLSVSINQQQNGGLCLKAHFDEFPYYYHKKGYPQLNYTVCSDNNLLELYNSQLERSFWNGHKQDDFEELSRLLKTPLWQLPVEADGHKLNITQVKKYIKNIMRSTGSVGSSSPRGYILLDSSWQDNMGDLTLSSRLRDVDRDVSSKGLTLVLTLTPFVSTDSNSYNEGVEKGLFVRQRKVNGSRDIPALTWYNNENSVALLDITNRDTISWIKSKLSNVTKEMPSVVFFVETGNAFHTPQYFEFEEELYNPDLYKDLFISVAMQEVKVIGVSGASSKRPKAPAFVHLTPLASNWDSLRSIIPNVLNLGVIGYPFISTGPVGGDVTKPGSNFTDRTSSNRIVPQVELFIRWWQLAIFMPQIHFTVNPKQYSNKHMARVSENLKRIKELIVNPALGKFSSMAMNNSLPVIRPLWMLDSNDSIAQSITDEFLIGDKILVAPVLHAGAVTRDVYLPRTSTGRGVWKRGTDGSIFHGEKWLNNSAAPLDTVLYFERQDDLPSILNSLLSGSH